MKDTVKWADFAKIDMRIGTVVEAEIFKEAIKPAIKLKIDFGKEIGVLKSSAQITDLYKPGDLVNQQLVAVVNFPLKQIANIKSECLVIGALSPDAGVVLLQPERRVDNGLRIA